MSFNSKIPFGDLSNKWTSHKFNLNLVNPANKKKLFKLSVSSKSDVDKAVKSAKKAFPLWSKTSIRKHSE